MLTKFALKNKIKMKNKKIIKSLGLNVVTATCGQSKQSCVDTEFVDDVAETLAVADRISFGIYACSPEESSFKAVFSDMKITECMWKAHDGQQPDME